MKNRDVLIPTHYRDYVYILTYYLLSPVAPLIPRWIKPNYITICSFISAITGVVLLVCIKTPVAYLYFLVFHLIWFLLDALDGMHARLTNQTSQYGGFLDHACDMLYFLFMLTAFIAKFHLNSTLYVYILLSRTTMACLLFVEKSYTGFLRIARISGGVDFLLMSLPVLLTYFYPHANPMEWTHNSTLQHWIGILDLQQGVFMKMILWIYFIGVPIHAVLEFCFLHRTLNKQGKQTTT